MPAHCHELRRERIGPFDLADAEALEALQALSGPPKLIPMAEVVAHLPTQELDEGEVAFIKNGRQVATGIATGPLALVHRGELMAIAEVEEGMAQPVVVVAE